MKLKMFLLVVVLSLFAAYAYAEVEAQLYGGYDGGGYYIMNNSLGDGNSKIGRNMDKAWMEHTLYLGGKFIIDPKVSLNVRSYVLYHTIMGGEYGTNDNGVVYFDRAWVGYQPMEELGVHIGRIPVNDYTVGFASGMYLGSFEESGGRDGIKVSYNVSEDISVFGVYTKNYESSTQPPTSPYEDENINGRDIWSFLVGANIKMNDLFINPYIAYLYDHNTVAITGYDSNGDPIYTYGYRPAGQLLSVYAEAGMAPATGLNWILALGYSQGMGDKEKTGTNPVPGAQVANVGTDNVSDYNVYGVYLDVSFVQEAFKVGGLLAYSSFDKKNGYFQFGGDFDKSVLIDDMFGAELGGQFGVPAMTMLQLYGGYNITEEFGVDVKLSYYMSNVDKDSVVSYTFGDIGKDTTAYELDAILSYKFSESTVFLAGAAYAQFNDLAYGLHPTTIGKLNTLSPDPVTMLFWKVSTNF